MAKTPTKARPRAKPQRARPFSGRSGPRSVGRRRGAPSPLSSFVSRLWRIETAGALLVAFAATALASLPSLVSLEPPAGLIEALGLHVVSLFLLLAGLGVLIWRRDLALVLVHPRVVVAAALVAVISAGLLTLLNPDLRLASVSLATVSAGGDLGRLLVGSVAGVLVWLASGLALATVLWPQRVRDLLRGSPGALATVWRWRLPERAFRGFLAAVDFAFPTKAPPEERPEATPPPWLPTEPDPELEAVDEVLEGVAPAPDYIEVTPHPPRQVELPIGWEDDGGSETVPVTTSGWKLPPMDLLLATAPAEETAPPDNGLRASLIVETLASFGVDARVAQFHEGPVVTQFDVEPGWEIKQRQVQERDKAGKTVLDPDGKPKMRSEEVSRTRVRVNQITSLANDLALALAAPSLRIEAPVPGRSVVGIEVPNTSASVVTLRSVIETPAFQRLAARSRIALPLGKSVSGEPVVADLAKMPHLLIAGATGSGKSVCINSIIASILVQAKPEEVRFVMIDPKRVELSSFGMIPHLAFSSIVVDVEKVVGTLGAVLQEMESRYKRFASLAVRNLEGYNRHPKVMEHLPNWVVIIDELADLMMAAPFEVERQICRLAQLARATGIHLIVATQRPSVDVVTGLIKANFPTRIAFATTSQVDSRTILDSAGAERLLGRGDMLYMPTDASKPKRVQGVFVSDQEIDRLVAFWAEQRAQPGNATLVYDHLLDQAQAAIMEEAASDPLFERAKALAEEHSRVSTSMLQRRLRIGYPRAARLMDLLEEDGVVGGSVGGSREVLADDDDEDADEPGFKAPY